MARDIITGARARLTLNGVKIGYAAGVNVRESLAHERVPVLDQLERLEDVPLGYEASGDAQFVRITNQGLGNAGFWPKKGQSSQEFLANVLAQGDTVMQIEDSQTGTVIAELTEVKFTERSMNFQPRAVTMENASFLARWITDESEG